MHLELKQFVKSAKHRNATTNWRERKEDLDLQMLSNTKWYPLDKHFYCYGHQVFIGHFFAVSGVMKTNTKLAEHEKNIKLFMRSFLESWQYPPYYFFIFYHCSNNERRFLRLMNEPTWTLNMDCYYPETSFALLTSFLSHFYRILHLICFVFYFQLDLIDFFSSFGNWSFGT